MAFAFTTSMAARNTIYQPVESNDGDDTIDMPTPAEGVYAEGRTSTNVPITHCPKWMTPCAANLLLFICAALTAASIWIIALGANALNEADKFMGRGTTEMCLLQSYTATACQHCCYESTTHPQRHCAAKCWAHVYEYTATVESKCGSKILKSLQAQDDCPDVLKIIGREYECVVLDCEEGLFTMDERTDIKKNGIEYTVIGSFLLSSTLCITFYFCYCFCRGMCKRKLCQSE